MTETLEKFNPLNPKWNLVCRVQMLEAKVNDVSIEHFEVKSDSIESFRILKQGRGCKPGIYTKLVSKGTLWMSDTDAEISDHRPALWQMYHRGGRILVNGLGLGMVVKAALALPNVEHVDVVETNPDIIELVGHYYESERCTIHHADAFDIQWPANTRWSVAWHDIWPDICEDNLSEYTRLKRKYGRRVDWQGCWAEDTIRREKYRTRNEFWRN